MPPSLLPCESQNGGKQVARPAHLEGAHPESSSSLETPLLVPMGCEEQHQNRTISKVLPPSGSTTTSQVGSLMLTAGLVIHSALEVNTRAAISSAHAMAPPAMQMLSFMMQSCRPTTPLFIRYFLQGIAIGAQNDTGASVSVALAVLAHKVSPPVLQCQQSRLIGPACS